MSKIIMGIKLMERMKSASKVQDLLSKYGCEINTRIGLHAVTPTACSPHGIILLEFINDVDDKVEDFEKELTELAKVDIQKMIF